MFQDIDDEELVTEAINTCPVDCIYWVDFEDLKTLEKERESQVLDGKVCMYVYICVYTLQVLDVRVCMYVYICVYTLHVLDLKVCMHVYMCVYTLQSIGCECVRCMCVFMYIQVT
jgi:hypothetical protein